MKKIIKNKILLAKKLTARERAMFLLFYATSEEAKNFIKHEKRGDNGNEIARTNIKKQNDC